MTTDLKKIVKSNKPMDSIYTYTVPVFIKALGGLRGVLEKGKIHLVSTNGSEADFMNACLAPNMYPLVKQVQVATDNAKGATARLSGGEAPVFEDNETTIDQLFARIDKTIAYLQTFPESAFKGAAERHIVIKYFPGKHLTGFDYAREYAIPNFFFHVTVAYALVRHQDVEIGKGDYINGLSLKDGE
jgi:hypothetical protein